MIFIKWLFLAFIDIAMLLTVPFAAPIIAAFTRAQSYHSGPYTWGWIWGTYDNPPQGDEGYVSKRALFKNKVDGLRGYVNRVLWMWRNPLYGISRYFAFDYDPSHFLIVSGNPDVSDKYRIPGYYYVTVRDVYGKLLAFEFYAVIPWLILSNNRDLRIRLGWKLLTDKFAATGFAPLVNTCNPFDGYGDD